MASSARSRARTRVGSSRRSASENTPRGRRRPRVSARRCLPKLAKEYAGVLAADELRPHLMAKTEGNSTHSNGRSRSGFRTLERFGQLRVSRLPGDKASQARWSRRNSLPSSAILAFGGEVRGHRAGILESLRRTSSRPGAGSAPASLRTRLSTYSVSTWPKPSVSDTELEYVESLVRETGRRRPLPV